MSPAVGTRTGRRPNVIVCLFDDLGFSDLGCYGAEIETPVVDGLADRGARFTQFYNAARCCPSRASLLTGLHPHQAGVGHMVAPGPGPAYAGYLNDRCVTIAEALRRAGYQTFMSGKWHVGGNYDAFPRQRWRPGDTGFPTPLQRGFEQFYGTLTGSGSYYQPATLMRQDTFIEQDDPDWYYTDAIADEACAMIGGRDPDRPFFLYLAFTAPHWPLHARAELIEHYRGPYRRGWDVLRGERHERLLGAGLLPERWRLSPRDAEAWAWEETIDQDWDAARMAAYAAQVTHADRALGQVMRQLRDLGLDDDTLTMVLSDNGGCPELLREDVVPDDRWPSSVPLRTATGEPVHFGNRPDVLPGGPDTFASYDICWSNLSNSPFRRFKRWVHEGGISTPFILHWPEAVPGGGIVRSPFHLIDIMPTILDAAGTAYPSDRDGQPLPALPGISLLPYLEPEASPPERFLGFEHEGNRALRAGDWKIVSLRKGLWELYNMHEDRTELVDLAGTERARLTALTADWHRWADEVGANPSIFDDDAGLTARYVSISSASRRRYHC